MNILVVEDEPRVAAAIQRSLVAAGYKVTVLKEANIALKKAYDLKYDLIILDRMLPGNIDGLEITKKLRQDNINTPILLLTALGEVADRVDGLSAGADDYVIKPFSIKELLARVAVLLRRPKNHIGSILRVEDLMLNTITNEVKRSNREIKLSKREFKLLTYFMYNPGQVISKERIINHVWDADALILPNTVEVYMGYIRKKIDKAYPDRPNLVHTVFGFGYRLGIKDDD